MIMTIDLSFPNIPDACDRKSMFVGIQSQKTVS